jgi:phospholipid transport system substrate-binding protein
MGCLLLWPAAAWSGETATEAIKKSIDTLIRVLSDEALKKPDRVSERRKLMEKIIGERFSYEEMARRSLAAQWAKLDEKQRTEFVDLFMRLLTRSYSDKIEGYSGEQVHYLNERMEEGYAEVRTKITSGKTEIPLDYRLLNKAGDWRIYDVVVDGVSLVSNYRGQFAKIIRTSGYDDLVKQLREKSDQFVKVKPAADKE